jgi:hypothetical protein
MTKSLERLRRRLADEAASRERDLRANFGDGVMDSRAGRVGMYGVNAAVALNALAPFLAFVVMFGFVGVQTALGQPSSVRPLDGDSGTPGRTIVAIIKWAAVGVLCLSILGIFWAFVNGLRGEAWQGKLGWSIAGFGIGGIVAWAVDIGQGKDPVFDTTGLGR